MRTLSPITVRKYVVAQQFLNDIKRAIKSVEHCESLPDFLQMRILIGMFVIRRSGYF